MDAEDGAVCPHMWRLDQLELGEAVVELVTRYRCELCQAVLDVPPGEHPKVV